MAAPAASVALSAGLRMPRGVVTGDVHEFASKKMPTLASLNVIRRGSSPAVAASSTASSSCWSFHRPATSARAFGRFPTALAFGLGCSPAACPGGKAVVVVTQSALCLSCRFSLQSVSSLWSARNSWKKS